MIIHLFILFIFSFQSIQTKHFNGGTINWKPVYPYLNSTKISIIITQSYSWTYPTITCANNVPITTPGRSSQNDDLICMSDCSTDGNYSQDPIDILTDCQTVIPSLSLMTSQRSVTINLTANAHFYLAHVGAAWAPINYPSKSGLQWSIVTFIDLRFRPDGIINTPPVASVVSPQYAIVNRTTQITVPVSDVNPTDDVRCRWSVYKTGSRRRKRFHNNEEETHSKNRYASTTDRKAFYHNETMFIRKKRGGCKNCQSTCVKGSSCCCPNCIGTTCEGGSCKSKSGCPFIPTTPETPGTTKVTSSFPTRQAIDECGGICYPTSVPTGTTLSNCTITFKGLVPDTWYAVSLQVEDFLNDTDLTPLSSVPVQFLIYVMDEPICGLTPIILPLKRCFDAQVNVLISFNISAFTPCDPTVSVIDTITISSAPEGVNVSETIELSTNASVAFATFTWRPLTSQMGSQQLCVIAFSDEMISSSQYCMTFTVVPYPATCITTTTTTTSTTTSTSTTRTTRSTSTSSTSTSTTSTSTTTASTSSTSVTSSTSSTSTSTTSTTTSSSTSTSSTTTTTRTSTTTSVTTTTTTSSSTSSSSTTTSTTSTTSSTSTSSSSTSTSTTTSVTSTTSSSTSSVTSTTVTMTKKKKNMESGVNWLLILGLSLLSILLALCISCCCLYRLVGIHRMKRRYSQQTDQKKKSQSNDNQIISPFHLSNSLFSQSNKSKQNKHLSYSNQRFSIRRIHQNDKPIEIGNQWMKPPIDYERKNNSHGKYQINLISMKNDPVKVKRISRNEIHLMDFH